MRFITESELRQLYRQEAFTTYTVPPNVRFTPEAHQFLVDRRIEVIREEDVKSGARLSTQAQPHCEQQDLLELVEDGFDEVEARVYLLQATCASYGNTELLEATSQIRRQLSQLRACMWEDSLFISEEAEPEQANKGFSIYTYSVNHMQAELLGQLALVRSGMKGIRRQLKAVDATDKIASYRKGLDVIAHQIEYVIKHQVGGF